MIQAGRAQKVSIPRAVRKACALHQLQHTRRARKAPNRRGQILIRRALAGDPSANHRQDAVKVKVVKRAAEPLRLIAFNGPKAKGAGDDERRISSAIVFIDAL